MENLYDVGIANRFALFLDEGDSSLTAIRKKISKETRIKDKQNKKENAEVKKVETAKTPEKVKKPVENKPVTNDVTPPKKDVKDKKNEATKGKEKKVNDTNAKRKEKDPQDKNNRNTKPNENDSFDIEVKDKESNKFNDSTGPRKNNNYEKGKNREKKFENDKFQSKTSPTSTKKLNDDDWGVKDEWGDTTAERYQNEDNRNIKENGHGPYNDVKPRGGRFNKGTRGGRNTYGGGDRRKEFDQSTESKEDFDTNKNESNGEDKAEVDAENADNQKDDENKAAEGDGSGTSDQKEVKEFLTLDEWKKLQGARQKPQYNLRKAGEGEDLTQWKNMRELQKKRDEEYLKNGGANQSAGNNETEEDNAGNEVPKRVARQKHLDINVHFRDAPVRGRGGRVIRSNRFGYKGANFEQNENFGGEPRSFRKPREPREPREGPPSGRGGHRQNAPKMDDEHAFPSLG